MQLEVPNIRDLQEQVFWEAEQYIPFDVSEVVMDFHMLSRAKDNKTDVLLVAVKRSILEVYMACIQRCGIKGESRRRRLHSFLLQNLYESNYHLTMSAAAVAVVGTSEHQATKIVVVQDGIPVFTKDSTLGGKATHAGNSKTSQYFPTKTRKR